MVKVKSDIMPGVTYTTDALTGLHIPKKVQQHIVEDVKRQVEKEVRHGLVPLIERELIATGIQYALDAAVATNAEMDERRGAPYTEKWLLIHSRIMNDWADAINSEYDETDDLIAERAAAGFDTECVDTEVAYTKQRIDELLKPLYGKYFLPYNERVKATTDAAKKEIRGFFDVRKD